MNRSWTSHKQVMNKSWTSHEQVNNKSLKSDEQVMNKSNETTKSWASQKQVSKRANRGAAWQPSFQNLSQLGEIINWFRTSYKFSLWFLTFLTNFGQFQTHVGQFPISFKRKLWGVGSGCQKDKNHLQVCKWEKSHEQVMNKSWTISIDEQD